MEKNYILSLLFSWLIITGLWSIIKDNSKGEVIWRFMFMGLCLLIFLSFKLK